MRRRHLSIIGPGLVTLALVPLLGGCSNLLVLEPKGPIGDAERVLILQSIGLMLIVAVPVIAMSIIIPWRYRATNTKATYAPGWTHSNRVEAVVWLVPTLIVAALGFLVWTSTHRLDPYKPIVSDVPPLEVEAVSLNWKWLFIYPRLGIATLNQLVFPTNTPLSLRITSDSVMTAFFVPQLGSQIYAMAGMETKLNLEADETGKYLGENTQYSGSGYSYMNFDAMATSREDFDRWVEKVKRSPEVLNKGRLAEIEKPSARMPVEHFSSVTPKLFEAIIAKYMSMGRDEPVSMPAAGQGSSSGLMDELTFEFERNSNPGGPPPAGTDAAASEPVHPATQPTATSEEN
jgi:cytochrome o ubiquinol oxidase subunit 2